MASEDKSLYVPLLDNESPRQKKNRILKVFQSASEFHAANPALQPLAEKLTPECLEDIESLPESYIESLVRYSFNQPRKKYRGSVSFDAFYGKFSQLGEKTKKVVAAVGFKLRKETKLPNIPYFADEAFVFFHADQLAQKSANYGRTRKFFFYRAQRDAVTLIAQRIVNVLTPRGNVANPHLGLLALQNDEFEKYKQACLRLEQLPSYLKAAFFKNLFSVPADQQERREEIVAAASKIAEAIELVITHKDSKDVFPNLTLFFAQMTVGQKLGRAVSSMNVGLCKVALLIDFDSAAQLESFIRCLIAEVENSTFKGKYEDMLELCLVKLMALSDPKEGLNLDPELLKKCLGILDNYFWTSNRQNFLMTRDTKPRRERVTKSLPLFYFIQRRLRDHHDVFANYPKVRELTLDYKDAFDMGALPQSEEDFQRVIENSLVRFDVQELFQIYLLHYHGSPITTSLVRYYGANINAVRDDGKRLLLWLIEENGKLHAQGEVYNNYSSAIHVLLLEGVTVAQEDVDAAARINTNEGRHLLGRLREKLAQQPAAEVVRAKDSEPVGGKGKEENEEDKVPVARVEEKPKSPQELGELLKREIINFVDINEILELIAKGADVTVLGTFTAARQLVYDRVSMGKKLDDVRNICGQLQRAYGALANDLTVGPVIRLRRLLDAEQYEVDINDAVMQAGPTAIGQLSIRELRKLCKYRLTQNTIGHVRRYVRDEKEFDLCYALRENNEPLLTLVHKACEAGNYELAYVGLRVLPDANDEDFLKDTSNYKELLLESIAKEEKNEGTDKARWAKSASGMVKKLHNHIYPQAKPSEVAVVPPAPAVEEKPKVAPARAEHTLMIDTFFEAGNLAKLKEVLSDERFSPVSSEAQVVNTLVYSLDGEILKGLAPGLKHKLCRCDLTEAAKAKLYQHGFDAYLLSGIIYKDGDVSELEKCKANGVDVHAQDDYGHTGLYSAVQFSNDSALQWLVSQGVKPSERDLAKAEILRSLEVNSDKEGSQTTSVECANDVGARLNKVQSRVEETQRRLEESQRVLDANQRRVEELTMTVSDHQTSSTPAALLGEVIGREGAHPVHARRNSSGGAEFPPSHTTGAASEQQTEMSPRK